MNGPQQENSVKLRFEKVFSFFLDGIPKPFVLVSPITDHGVTFAFNSFGFSPDYTAKTEVVDVPEFKESSLFNSLALCHVSNPSPSSRIGAHYSPYVGTFRMSGKVTNPQKSQSPVTTRRVVRIPVETSEQTTAFSPELMYDLDRETNRESRAGLMIDLYTKVFEDHLVYDQNSLRRIVILATKGLPSIFKTDVERELMEIKKLIAKACGQSLYEYMCQSSLFCRVMLPMCVHIPLRSSSLTRFSSPINEKQRIMRSVRFKQAMRAIDESLLWNENTNKYFIGVHGVWMDRLDRLVLFDTTTSQWKMDAGVFVTQLECSMRAAFTRIRIEFYTQVENLLFDSIKGSRAFLSLDSESIKNSVLKRIFLATRVFLVNRLRSMIFDALRDLVLFFTAGGKSVISATKARKIPVIEVFLIVGGSGTPRSPSFAQLRFGISDLLDELVDSANSLPTPEAVIMRTIDVERRSLNAFNISDFSVKTTLLMCLDAAESMIESLTEKYTVFATLPLLGGVYFSSSEIETVQTHINLIRKNLNSISTVSSDIVFCGCIAINCIELKRWYTERWSRYYENYLSAVKNNISAFLQATLKRCCSYNEILQKEPKDVEELEELSKVIKDTETLSRDIRASECAKVISWFDCLERLQVTIDSPLYLTAMDLMRCPSDVLELSKNAQEIRLKCQPYIIEKLNEFRSDTQKQVSTIRDGVSELLSMFNLEVCDIAAQTCEELRVIVDRVIKGIDYISFCEHSLKIEQVDSFEDFVSLLSSFEVLEQFWSSIFDSTVVKDYYNTAVSDINAEKMIDNVQRCRRLLHSSARSLRAYPGLVRLGRQQEHVLSDFESLQSILICITTPGLRKNHWKEITRLLASELPKNTHVDSSVTLLHLLRAGIDHHLNNLKNIVEPALMDFKTESSLELMKSEAKRTRFIFEPIVAGKDVVVLSPSCRESIFAQLESFIGDSRSLRSQTLLSQFVINSINEWEAASEKMRSALLHWKEVEHEWMDILRFGMTLDFVTDEETPAPGSRDWKFLHEKIVSVNDIFSVLCTTLQKRQYTLFTAMVQENVQEQLSLACTILGDVKKVIAGLLDAKREIFPRFCFLTDEELLSFLSVLNRKAFTCLLSKMYNCVCDVTVEDNMVTAFLTSDGAVLRSIEPIMLSAIPIERWMNIFEKRLRASLLHEIKACIESHYHLDSSLWLRSSCTQVVNVALRIMHNRDFREVLSLAGSNGITAYQKRLKDLTEEYIRLAWITMERDRRNAISAAITYFLWLKREVLLAVKSGVHTPDELDMTAMLQTCMEKDDIYIQFLGIRLPYGFEFLGNHSIPVFTSQFIEKTMYSTFLSFSAGSFPLCIGSPEKIDTLHHCAEFLGRFWWCFQCRPTFSLESLSHALRGAISVGAILCLKDVDLVNSRFLAPITKLLQSVISFSSSGIESQDQNEMVRLTIEPNSPSVNIRKNPCFQVVLTSSKADEIPTALALGFRPIYLPSVDLTAIAQSTLQAIGFAQCMTIGPRFAAIYEQFREVAPSTFTVKSFLVVMYNAAVCNERSPVENLGVSFLHQFWPVLRSSSRLQRLLDWNATQTLGIPSDIWDEIIRQHKSLSGFDALLAQFTDFMTHNPNVILVGPDFSGKTDLWKRWVDSTRHIIISPKLLSCAEIYGTETQQGLLSSLSKEWNPIENCVIIIEDADVSQNSIIFDTPIHTRIRPYSGPDFIQGPFCRVIAVTSKFVNANPRVMTEFAVFTLSECTNWKTYLREELQRAPTYHPDTAFATMTILIEAILDTWSSLGRPTTPYESHFAVATRCSKFYKRWYVYAQACSESKREEWLSSEQTFAMQCAIFATYWSLGLCLQTDERRVLRVAVDRAQTKLNKLSIDMGFTEETLPPMEDDIMLYISTPAGWRKLGQPAEAMGFVTTWASQWADVDITQRAWTQFFNFPSREASMISLEYLVNANQPVLLVGKEDQGKSTILRNMRGNERWVHHLAYNNPCSGVSSIQDAIFSGLSLRHSKVYGPPIGRKLVLCVDDVHLQETRESDFSQVMHLFSFIDRHAAICSSSIGYIPITDVVCVGSTRPVSYGLHVEGTVMRMQLPFMDDAEIVGGIRNLFEMACASRRSLDMCKEVSLFLAVAQAIALRIVDKKIIFCQGTSEIHKPMSPIKSNKEDLVQEYVRRRSFSSTVCEPFLSYLYFFMKISDRALRLLASPWIDRDVISNIYSSTYAFYAAILEDTEHKEELEVKLRHAAEATLRTCCPSTLAFDANAAMIAEEDEHDDRELPPVMEDEVREWMSIYERLIFSGVVEELPFVDSDTSVVYAPPSQRLMVDAKKQNATAYGSQVKYPSRWMTLFITQLHQALRQDQSHVALIGPHEVGIRRALRIWGVAVRLHVALFRDGYTRDGAQELFKKDLVDVLQRACRNEGRMIIFLPNNVVTLPWAMSYIDAIVRGGDVSQLFTPEEQLLLLHGRRGSRRSSGRLLPSEVLELRRRICRRLVVVVHITSHEQMTRLRSEFPLISFMLPLTLHFKEVQLQFAQLMLAPDESPWTRGDVVIGGTKNIITVNDQKDLNPTSPIEVMGRSVASLLCDIFNSLSDQLPLCVEQLLELSFHVKRLQHYLARFRRITSRSRHVLGLPEAIVAKSCDYQSQYERATTAAISVASQINDLNIRVIKEEERAGRFRLAASRHRRDVTDMEELIAQEEEELKSTESKAATDLAAAEGRLRSLKKSQMKALATLRLPEKGALLVRTICRVIGEDLRHGSAQDTWARGREIMSAPKFIARLIGVPVNEFSYESLAPLHTSLSEVRYGEASVVLAALAEYLVAFMESVRITELGEEERTRLEDLRAARDSAKSNAEGAERRVEEASLRVKEACTEVMRQEKRAEVFAATCEDMKRRQATLVTLADLADRFAPFGTFDDETARVVDESNGEVVVIFASLFHALLAPRVLEEELLYLKRIRSVFGDIKLDALGVTSDDSRIQMLFPVLTDIAENALVSCLGVRERIFISALMQRIFLRWPFFGGVSPCFERVVRQCLRQACKECVVISSMDRRMSEHIIAAAVSGAGVLLCDVAAEYAIDYLLPLFVLRASLIAAMSRGEAFLSCNLFGKRVEVRTSFYLVCVSPNMLPVSGLLHRYVCIVNFTLPIKATDTAHATLLLTLGNESEVCDLCGIPKDEGEAVANYHDAWQQTEDLLCKDLEQLAANQMGELEQLTILLTDLTNLQPRVVRATMYRQNLSSRLHESWRQVEQGVRCMEVALRIIEGRILGREWMGQKLDSIVARAADLPRAYQRRIMPNNYSGLAESHKEFYATVCLVERVVQIYACGWPRELRGIFAFFILSSVVTNCDLIVRLRGQLYSSAVILLNREQFRILQSLLNPDETNSKNVRSLLATSSDPLLRDVAANVVNEGGDRPWMEDEAEIEVTDDPITAFFANWVRCDYAACDFVALCLYDAFFFAVKEQSGSDGNGDEEIALLYECRVQRIVEVHSMEEFTLHCANGGSACYAKVTDVRRAVKYMQQRAANTNCPYFYYHIATSSDVAHLVSMTTNCFSTRPENQGRHHHITVVIDPPTDTTGEAALARSLALFLARFNRYGGWGPRRGDCVERSPVFLCCLMSEGSGHGVSCATILEEFALALLLEVCEPRFHFVSLMERATSLLPWRREGATLVLPGPNFATGTVAITLPGNQTGTTGSMLAIPGPVTEKVSRRGTRSSDETRLSNVLEVHVGVVAMQGIARALWLDEGFGPTVPNAATPTCTIDDDDLILLLRLMACRMRPTVVTEPTAGAGAIFRRQSIRQGHQKSSLLDREPFNAQREREKLYGIFCKLAYGIYNARLTTTREQLLLVDLLRRVVPPQGTHPSSVSVTVDEVAKSRADSDAAFLMDLSQSPDDFFDLCGDKASAQAHRLTLTNVTRNFFLHAQESSTQCPLSTSHTGTNDSQNDEMAKVDGDSIDPPTGEAVPTVSTAPAFPTFLNNPTTSTVPAGPVGRRQRPSAAAPTESVGIVSAWETGHAERLAAALSAAGNTETAQHVLAAAARLLMWVPGDTLSVWLPALRHPQLLLATLAARAAARKTPLTPTVENTRIETVLVLLHRSAVRHDDVILVGAAPSALLEREVIARAGWDPSQLSWRHTKTTPSSPSQRTMNRRNLDDDIVVIVRFQRGRVEGTATESASEVLWEIRPGEKRLDGAAPPPRAARPSVVFLTAPSDMVAPAPATAEVQTPGAIPVLCAAPVVFHDGPTQLEEEEPPTVARVERHWRALTDMPLLVFLTEEEWVRRRTTTAVAAAAAAEGPISGEEEIPLGRQTQEVQSRRNTCVSLLDGSLGFFLTIS